MYEKSMYVCEKDKLVDLATVMDLQEPCSQPRQPVDHVIAPCCKHHGVTTVRMERAAVHQAEPLNIMVFPVTHTP